MAGRGKGMTLPAWMTSGDHQNNHHENHENQLHPPPPPQQQQVHLEAHGRESGSSKQRSRSRSRSRSGRSKKRSRSRSSRRSGHSRDRDRGRRDRDRDRDSGRAGGGRSSRGRSASPDEEPAQWVSRRKNKKSNFDVKPPEGTVLPPIGGLGTSLNPALPVGMDGSLQSGMTHDVATMQQTKHARRIYIGGIASNTTDKEIENFIRDAIYKAMAPEKPRGEPVLSSYVNRDKCFCFIELNSIELTTACCSLDGIAYKGNTLKIRRPNDFRPHDMPTDLPPAPTFNLSALGVVSTNVSEGPGKIFVGGLPYHLTEEEIKELLSAFGPLKSFHLVKDAGATLSKGYAFCEYADLENTHVACQGLNGLQVGDKTLTVRVATQSNAPPAPSTSFAFNGTSSQANPYVPPPQLQMQPANLADKTPTKVIILKNMVTVEELQDDQEFGDICEDVKEECSQHGKVLSVLIPRVKENYPKQCEGSVFVEFELPEVARAAALSLSGRKFAGRTVDVDYFDETKFANRALL